MMKLSKSLSLLIVVLVYVAAFFAGLLVFRILPFKGFFAYLCADAAATVVVWAFGLVFRNASMYDPYWSVAPIVLFICFLTDSGFLDAVDVLYIAVFTIWGVRLTLNWAIGWRGMAHQDWRYTMLHDKNPKVWFFTNFFGINMLPTLFVFVNMLPPYLCAYQGADTIGALSVLGLAVCVFAVMMQIISDGQMRRFRSNAANSGTSIQTGLWKYSRHPNYLGEVSLWWGVWIIQAGTRPDLWWSMIAPIMMTLLFVLISIPMMENRLTETKSDYDTYQQRTSMLLLLPPKRIGKQADESVGGSME